MQDDDIKTIILEIIMQFILAIVLIGIVLFALGVSIFLFSLKHEDFNTCNLLHLNTPEQEVQEWVQK